MKEYESVTDRVSKSAVALIIRQVLSFVLNVTGGIFLARLLTPTEFGIYAIALFAFKFIRVFGEVGLGASLIRSKKEPVYIEYASIYTIQQVAVVGITIVFWLLAPWIVHQYDLAAEYVWLLRLIALALVAISFMVIPRVQLERNLEFEKLAIVEVLQAAAFNGVAVVLAFYGYGAFALGWGFLARAVIGAILVNIIHPWRISFQIKWGIVKKHLKFGVSFQAISFIGTINNAINPVLMAMIFGVAGAGYVEWAILLVGYLQRPLVLLNRVLFPAFSKVRENVKNLVKGVNYTYMIASFTFFALAGLLFGLAPQTINIVYTNKWMEALSLLYLLIISKAFVPMSMPNGALGYALGWANPILYINIGKSIFLWVSVLICIAITDSILAYGYAMILTECWNLILYFMLKKELPQLTILKTQLVFVVAAVATAFTLMQGTAVWAVTGGVHLIAAMLLGGLIYLIYSGILYSLYYSFTKDDRIFQAAQFLYKNMTKKLRRHS